MASLAASASGQAARTGLGAPVFTLILAVIAVGLFGIGMLSWMTLNEEMARPFAAPPGIPEDRKAALIAAFEATMKDPEFLSEAQKLSIDVAPVTAAHLNSLLADLYATPKAVLQKAAVAVAK